MAVSVSCILKQKLFVSHQNIIIIQSGMTGLMEASRYGYTETVSVLLAAKADPNITDEVKLHYSHCLYNSNLMHYVTVW